MRYTNQTKLVITISAIVISIIIIVWAALKIKNTLRDTIQNSKLVDEANKEIDANAVTLTQSQLLTLCDKLYRAMKGIGTNEQAIFEVFQAINSRSDLLMLIKIFGVRDGETLKQWLYSDLNNSEIQKINYIIESKGINYKF